MITLYTAFPMHIFEKIFRTRGKLNPVGACKFRALKFIHPSKTFEAYESILLSAN